MSGELPQNSDPSLPAERNIAQSVAELGMMIRARRTALGMQQRDVASLSKVPLPTVSEIENGKETTQIGQVLQICRALRIGMAVIE